MFCLIRLFFKEERKKKETKEKKGTQKNEDKEDDQHCFECGTLVFDRREHGVVDEQKDLFSDLCVRTDSEQRVEHCIEIVAP